MIKMQGERGRLKEKRKEKGKRVNGMSKKNRTFPRHARLIPRAFAAFPEAGAASADKSVMAIGAVGRSVGLFAGAESAD